MITEKQTGRLIGALLLVAMLLGLWNNFGLTAPIFSGAGYLHQGAQMPLLFGASALLGLVTSAIGLAVGVVAWPVLRPYSPYLALAFLLLTAVGLATSAMEQSSFLSMLSLSQQYAQTASPDPVLFELLRSMVSADRNGIHYIDKIIAGGGILVLHLALFRSRLLPRFIPAFGAVAALIQMSGISLELFSRDLPPLMLAPLALAQLVLCLTLLVRGFSPGNVGSQEAGAVV